MLKNCIKFFINIIVSLITIIIPKSKEVVICGGWFGERFADNSKSMFLFLSDNKAELGLKKVLWITKNKHIMEEIRKQGYDAYICYSIFAIWYALKAYYHIVDEGGIDIGIIRVFSTRSKRINLWHGFPLKRIGYLIDCKMSKLDNIIKYNKKMSKYDLGLWKNQYMLSLSVEQKKHMEFAFAIPEQKNIIGSYPRSVYMLGHIRKFLLKSEQKRYDKIKLLRKNNKKIIFYLPTFRDKDENNNKCILFTKEIIPFLEKNDLYLITKLHFAAESNININIKSKRVINLTRDSDVYNFLDSSDILITDYSSVYFDYLLLNKPIIFYNFDIDYYNKNDRGFLYDYEDFTAGGKASTIEDLQDLIKTAIFTPCDYIKHYENQYKAVRNIVYENINPNIGNLRELWNVIK